MSFGGPVLRQHVVEFISNTSIGGVYTDGVRDATSTSGPWTWKVPAGVASITISGCGAGSGAGGGHNSSNSRAGGGGGAAGLSIKDYVATCYPSSDLIITIPTGGTGGAAGFAGTNGGATTIAGLCPQSWLTRSLSQTTTAGGTFYIFGAQYGDRGTATTSGTGGTSGYGTGGTSIIGASRGNPQNNGTTPTTGQVGTDSIAFISAYGAYVYAYSGTSGGSASTVGSTAGGEGRSWRTRNPSYLGVGWDYSNGSSGNTDGTISYGGGGGGAPSAYGSPGEGGNGQSVGGNAIGFGAGGGGGGGNAAGGNGSPGYVSITYWSVD